MKNRHLRLDSLNQKLTFKSYRRMRNDCTEGKRHIQGNGNLANDMCIYMSIHLYGEGTRQRKRTDRE